MITLSVVTPLKVAALALCASDEVMIQHDFARNGACTTLATAAFGGSDGVPVQKWHLCKYGSELIWKLTRNERSGSVDILSMLTWLVNHGTCRSAAACG
jgi:hypothetical protein